MSKLYILIHCVLTVRVSHISMLIQFVNKVDLDYTNFAILKYLTISTGILGHLHGKISVVVTCST